MDNNSYSTLPALAAVYLEDSYVLGIVERPGELRFLLDAVLTEDHPAHQPPKPGEQYCYADAWLVFAHVTKTEWLHRSTVTFTDATGEEDLGNIDYLTHDTDHWHVGGDWGELHIHTTTDPTLSLAENEQPESP